MLSSLKAFQPAVISLLRSRCVVKIEGRDTQQFLQGLITNDIYLLSKGHGGEGAPLPQPPSQIRSPILCNPNQEENGNFHRTIYSMYLNQKGRVLYDLLVYKAPNPDKSSDANPVYIEMDLNHRDAFLKDMKKYKIRKKVSFSSEDRSVLAAFSPEANTTSQMTSTELPDDLVDPIYPDPRLPQLGYRLLLNPQQLQSLSAEGFQCVSEEPYNDLRFTLGVGEGPVDHPIGKALPLECNLTELNGVSFHKGCYIGQELTARTYHTGVVRKRLMPVELTDNTRSIEIEDGCPVVNDNGKSVGVLRSIRKGKGLALLNVQKALSSSLVVQTEKHGSVPICAKSPDWWAAGHSQTS